MISLEQQRYSFNDQYLAALLQVYKDYYPDIIISSFRRAKSSVFRHPDLVFATKLQHLQSSKSPAARTFSRVSSTHRRHRTQVPELATFGATTSSTTIEELTSPEDFVSKLEKVQFPSQMVSILQDRRLQFLYLFRGGEIEKRRLNFWVSSALVEGMEEGSVGGLLRMCAEFVEVTKECPAAVEGFLRMYLKTWDGLVNRDSVFDVLLCLVPSDFDGKFP